MSLRTIVHIDVDAFFASVEQRDNPRLKGLPVIIGADPKNGQGRGVVATCSYEARKYGIHSAMPISQAFKKCRWGVFLPGRYREYRRSSDMIFSILKAFTPDMEPVSIDEAFLDISGSYHLFGTPKTTCVKIKREIKKCVGLTVSIGIAPVKMVAKIASDVSKPDGLLEIKEKEVLAFLWPMPVERLGGVGPKTQSALIRLGVRTIGDLAKMNRQVLYESLGGNGLYLHELANGHDFSGVKSGEEIKSLSHEHTFDQDTKDINLIRQTLLSLSEKVSRRLRKNDLKGRTLTVKIRLKGFKTYTRAHTLGQRTNHAEVIYQQALKIFNDFYRPGMMIRLLGVRLSQFNDPYFQSSLFENPSEVKRERLHQAMDSIKDKYGDHAIHRLAG